MAIYVETSTPNELINKIHELINNRSIEAWSSDQDGDITLVADQWKNKAWIRALPENNRVVFHVICRKDKNMSVSEYAIYHGKFIEMLLTHLDKQCEEIEVTPLASRYDIINAEEK